MIACSCTYRKLDVNVSITILNSASGLNEHQICITTCARDCEYEASFVLLEMYRKWINFTNLIRVIIDVGGCYTRSYLTYYHKAINCNFVDYPVEISCRIGLDIGNPPR